MMQLAHISDAIDGQLIGMDRLLEGVTTDSRGDCSDRLFIALSGPNFDAHDFIPQAQQQGAVAALVQRDIDTQLPLIKVADTQVALTQMAAWWRHQFVLPVIGVTGSVGKTTVKEMLGAIFAELGKGLVTHGNLNNEIGVPLTLLRLKPNDLYAIIEMGMNHAGEISRLTEMAKPTIALINNAGEAHLEGLGSVEAVAKAKGEIFQGLAQDGTAIINADDDYASMWQVLAAKHKQISFGLSNKADVTATYENENGNIVMQVMALCSMFEHRFEVTLSAFGEHNVSNALAAIAASLAANIPLDLIINGLSNYQTVGGRLNPKHLGALLLIDDTYNANPASMQAAINVLANYKTQTKYLIVGDMGELGDDVEAAHIAVGDYAKQQGIDCLYACGMFAEQVAQAFSGVAHSFTSQDALIEFLSDHLPDEGVCLVKGSRFTHMEKVVEFIDKQYQQTHASKGAITC